MNNTPDIYRAEGIWHISDVFNYQQNNQWPSPTDTSNTDCYSVNSSRQECGCVSVSLNGVVSTGVLTDPSGSTPGTEFSLPKEAMIITTDGFHWSNWWWSNDYFWNWQWRYPWYSRWWRYSWYWGYYCYRYFWWMNPVNLYSITCENQDTYPTCGTGTPNVTNFFWAAGLYGALGISYTPSSSGLIPSRNSTSYTYDNVTPGITPYTTTVNISVNTNNSGIIPWNATWSSFYNNYTINRGILLSRYYQSTTYDTVANTGNTGGTNGLDIVFSSGRTDMGNGYRESYYGSLRADDPTWSSIQWNAGYPAALTGQGKFWFAITNKNTTVMSGVQRGWLYDSNGSGYPVRNNYGSWTNVTQTTRFYQYNGCGSILDVTTKAVSGTPMTIGLYTPNQKTVNPLGYWYVHTKANVCDASYIDFSYNNGAYTTITCDSYLSFNREAYNYYYPADVINYSPPCTACENAIDPYDNAHPCLSQCGPGEGGEPISVAAYSCADALATHYDEVALINSYRPSCSTTVFAPKSLSEIDVVVNNYQYTIPCSSFKNYDSQLYYGYHFGVSSYRAGLMHPKIAWAVGEYTKNQFNCTGLMPTVSGLVFTDFNADALEVVSADSFANTRYYFPFGLFFGDNVAWQYGCRSTLCLNNEGKVTLAWGAEDFLAFNDDCSVSNSGYQYSSSFCGQCSTDKTVVDVSGISGFSPSGLSRQGSSVSYERHCYVYTNSRTHNGKTAQLYYEPISGVIPIINGVAYDTDPYFTSGNFIVNLTGISIPSNGNYDIVRNAIINNITFGLRSSGTGTGSVFNYRCANVQLYWPYCSGSSFPIKIVPTC